MTDAAIFMSIIVWDIWGKYINGISLVNTTKDGYRIPMRIFDICPKCREELIKWLGDDKEEGKEDGRE